VPDLDELLRHNRAWARDVVAREPDFFDKLVRQQAPELLWIGCSDSRVPANEITGLQPGELFVHRNVANLVVHTDFNCLSVLEYAVVVLGVHHVIVCGHLGCGGIEAALGEREVGLVDNWLRHVRDVHATHRERLEAITDPRRRWELLCELNVVAQVANVCATGVVRGAWERGHELAVHGLVYSLADGLLRDLGLGIRGPQEVAESVEAAIATVFAEEEPTSPARSA
jgi:carbonic anhydrase